MMDGETILVVEDNPGVRICCADALQRLGYTVVVAADGVAGMDALDRQVDTLCLVLTDFDMPGANGLAVARHSQARHPGVPIVLMSGHLPGSARSAARLIGATVLDKPFTMTQFLTVIRATLQSATAAAIRA